MEYPDFGFEKKMTKTDTSNTVICRYAGGVMQKPDVSLLSSFTKCLFVIPSI